MADRSVVVTLGAIVTPFTAGMAKAQAAATGLARSVQAQTAAASTGLTKMGTTAGLIPARFAGIGAAAGVAGAAVGIGIGLAVKKFADFDHAMSAVEASTGAAGAELEQLGQAALDSAEDTKFGATEAAQGIEALGKAGVSTGDIIGGGLAGALDLAAAGEIEVAAAAEVAAGAMTQFGLSGAKVPHIADLLAAAAGKAQGTVGDMAMAFKQSGLVASQMGLSIEETTGTLAAFASNALIGSDAGTSFRTMLLHLANPSGEAARLMDELGIAAYDSQGAFVGMESLAGQLQTALGGLSAAERDAALATIFGMDAVRGANVLYQQGAAGIADWTAKVDDAGFAAEQAATRTDNLKGDIEKLGGALESLAIGQAGGANSALRELVQTLTDVIGMLQEADKASQPFFDSLSPDEDQGMTTFGTGIVAGLDAISGGMASAIIKLDEGDQATKRYVEGVSKIPDAERAATAAQARLTGQAALYAGAAAGAAYATDQETAALAELEEQMWGAVDAHLALSNAEIGVQQAADDASAALEANGKTLNLNTQEGRNNQGALNAMADAGNRLMLQMQETGASEDEVTAKSVSLRAGLVATARSFGMNATQANAYADEVLGIPPKASTAVSTPGLSGARAGIAGLKAEIAGIPRQVYINISETITRGIRYTAGRVGGVNVGLFAEGGYVDAGSLPRFPAGGMVSAGSGGPRDDNVLIRASRGEFVVNAAATSANRGLLEAINSGRGGGAQIVVHNQISSLEAQIPMLRMVMEQIGVASARGVMAEYQAQQQRGRRA